MKIYRKFLKIESPVGGGGGMASSAATFFIFSEVWQPCIVSIFINWLQERPDLVPAKQFHSGFCEL